MVMPVDNLPMSDVVDLVNEYADVSRAAAGESSEPYPHLEYLEALGATASESVSLANAFHRVFAEPRRASDLLNQLADQHQLSHRLASDGRLAWMRPATSHRAAAAATATLIDFLNQHSSDRLGTCDADACADVYVDTSQSQTRSYCSDKCHTRTRVARWRARQRQTTATSSTEEDR